MMAQVPTTAVESTNVPTNSAVVGCVASRPWTKKRLAMGRAEPRRPSKSSANHEIATYSGAFTNRPSSARTESAAKSTIRAPWSAFVARLRRASHLSHSRERNRDSRADRAIDKIQRARCTHNQCTTIHCTRHGLSPAFRRRRGSDRGEIEFAK